MHTVMVLGIGFALLGIGLLVGGGAGSMATAALVFIPIWFVGACINLYLGVARAGCTVAEEIPVNLAVFAVPAAAALALWWKLR